MIKEELRKSIYKVFSDLIKQDELITVDEIECLDKVCKDYGITDAEKTGGHMMTLADAISTLQGEPAETRRDVLRKMEECAIKDKECCRNESLLLTAFKCCCEAEAKQQAYVISFSAANTCFNDTQLIYLEDQTPSETMASLEKDADSYADFCDICRLGGFNFIFIPRVAEHFREFKDQDILRDLVSLVSPSLQKDEADGILQVICEMSTSYFYQNVLRDKLQLPVRVDKPVWMFKIGHSVVGGQDYANFLCVEIAEETPKAQLRGLIHEITGRQSSYHLTINKTPDDGSHFEYAGFTRTLLEVMAVKKVTVPDIIIHPRGEEFPLANGKKAVISGIDAEGNRFPIVMDRREAAFYVLLLCACSKGGRGIEMSFRFNEQGEQVLKQQAMLMRQYKAIYQELSHWVAIPDITSQKILRPTRSYIARAIKNTPALSPPALYLPIERNGHLMLSIESDHVKVLSKGKTYRLLDSALYASYLQADDNDER